MTASVLGALLAALTVLVVPGLPVVLALGLPRRPLVMIAAVAPVSLALIGLSAELGHLWSVPWSPLLPLLMGLAAGLIVLPLRMRALLVARQRARSRSRHRRTPAAEPSGDFDAILERPAPRLRRGARRPAPRHRDLAAPASALPSSWPVLAGLATGGGLIAYQVLSMLGRIDQVSQTYDGIFHLNAVRYVMDRHDASAWVVGGMTLRPGQESWYPALWHQAASQVAMLTGGQLPLAANMLMLLVAALVWPLGIMALVATCTGARQLGVALAGALAGISVAFPLSLVSWGVVLPGFLSTALLPMALWSVVQMLGIGPRARRASIGSIVVISLLTMLAVTLAHPQGAFAVVVLGGPVLGWAVLVRAAQFLQAIAQALIARSRSRTGRARPGAARAGGSAAVALDGGSRVSALARHRPLRRLGPLLATALAAWLVYASAQWMWLNLRPGRSAAVWKPNSELDQAIWQTLSLAGNAEAPSMVLAVVVVLALLACLLLSRARWLALSFLGAGALAVAARCLPVGDARYLWTGPWYSDTWRIVALPVVAAVPMLAVGIDALVRALRVRRLMVPAPLAPVAAVMAASCLVVLGVVEPGMVKGRAFAATQWQSQVLLSDDERALLDRLPSVVPEDAVIATNAWNGSSLAYAISDRQVLNKTGSFLAGPQVHLLNRAVDDVNTDPKACDAAHALKVRYVLDFGPREIWGKRATYVGINDISTTGAADLVMREGGASLWKLRACRGTDGHLRSH